MEYYVYSLHHTELVDAIEISKSNRPNGIMQHVWTKVCLLSDERFNDLWEEEPDIDFRSKVMSDIDVIRWATGVMAYVVKNLTTKFHPYTNFPKISTTTAGGEFGTYCPQTGWKFKQGYLNSLISENFTENYTIYKYGIGNYSVKEALKECDLISLNEFPLLDSLSFETCELYRGSWVEIYNFEKAYRYMLYVPNKHRAYDITSREGCVIVNEILKKYYTDVYNITFGGDISEVQSSN